MPLSILFVGDIHLGRRPPRLPGALTERAREFGPAEAWRRTVDLALERPVDAVALAGDLVEREDDFYEAYRELDRGVRRLSEAGIRVYGVSGNHDVQVLPRLARQIPDFRLLGRDGEWECAVLEAGGERLGLWGWSFPRRQVMANPLEGHRFERQAAVDLGLLHCDRDQTGSPYAPVGSAALAAAGLDGWLLGHIHAPDALVPSHPIGYLGSLTGLDPGEPGPHGPWCLTVERGRIHTLRQHVLAPLRWETLTVDLEGIAGPEEAKDRVLEGVRDLDASLEALDTPPRVVGLRIRLGGRTRHGESAGECFGEDDRGELFPGRRGTHYFIERLLVETLPEVSLETLAARNDPLGLLARRLLHLEKPPADPERRRLIREARRRLEERASVRHFAALDEVALDDAAVATRLRQAARRLLEEMLAEQEPGK